MGKAIFQKAGNRRHSPPWLALILLDESELNDPLLVKQETILWKDYREALLLSEEPGEDTDKNAQNQLPVLWVKPDFLQKILPTAADNANLCHIRKFIENDAVQHERVFIVANRLPKGGSTSKAFLVSLENRFEAGTADTDSGKRNSDGFVPILNLFSWSFSCPSKNNSGNLGEILQNLDFKPFKIPTPSALPPQTKPLLPAQTEKLMSIGSMPVAHTLRGGGKTISWYRGPCIPPQDDVKPLPFKTNLRSSDDLLIYDTQSDMLNITYSSAWELSKLMVLSDSIMSMKIQEWKNAEALKRRYLEQQQRNSYLSIQDLKFDSDIDSELSKQLQAYFHNLSLLKGVPFHYLVPSELYLPKESIRIFKIDKQWIDILLKGAFSVGGELPPAAPGTNSIQDNQFPFSPKHEDMYGVFIRSFAIEGWPGLVIEGSTTLNSEEENLHKANIVRKEKLAPDLILCLFDKKVSEIKIYLAADALHCGFSRPTAEQDDFHKVLKDLQPGLDKSEGIHRISWKEKDLRVINATQIQQSISTKPIDFAIQLLEGETKVIFQTV